MLRQLAIYGAALLTIAVLDGLWLGVIAKSWYQNGMGHLMAPSPNIPAAAAFYLLYPIGLVIFAINPAQGDWARALMMGALFGLFAYGTYDVTNLAVLRDWPLGLSLLDTAWGAVVGGAAAAAGAYVAGKF
ncbi:MAG: DUF2177 family protein [Burkholderiales bacterium]|nr:DUF2177 family protein [Burkholderiales bacterium]